MSINPEQMSLIFEIYTNVQDQFRLKFKEKLLKIDISEQDSELIWHCFKYAEKQYRVWYGKEIT
jgi:hypothetical protein